MSDVATLDQTALRALAIELRAAADRVISALPADTAPPVVAEPTYLTMGDFAARHAVSKATVARWAKRGMPVHRIGSVVRVKVKDAETWLEGQGVAA